MKKIDLYRRILIVAECGAIVGFVLVSPTALFAQSAVSEPAYLVSEVPLVLLSANDAEIGSTFGPRPLSIAEDSITAIRLTSDSPPVIRTVYGAVPSSIIGAPRMGIVANGRYGIVSNNPTTLPQLFGQEPPPENPMGLVSIIDLDSPNLEVIDTIELPGLPQMVAAHPDDERFLVNTNLSLHMFRIVNGEVVEIDSAASPAPLNAFDVSANGEVALASALPDSLHVFSITRNSIEYRSQVAVPDNGPRPDQPFTVRISPNGNLAIVLNGNGLPDTGALDEAVFVDMTAEPPRIRGSLEAIADGLEGLAIHPDGHMAVIGCLNDHLAVLDLTTETPRLLYYLDRVGFPEGLEFSPDGSRLFVGVTGRNHIAVYDVDGFELSENRRVLRTGHSPTSLAVSYSEE